METTNQNSQQEQKQLTAQDIANLVTRPEIWGSGRIHIMYGDTQITLFDGNGNNVSITLTLSQEKETKGLVECSEWYFHEGNRDGDPDEYHYRYLTAQQVATLVNHLIQNPPKGYSTEWLYKEVANNQSEEQENIHELAQRIYHILVSMEEARKATEAADEAMKAYSKAEQIAIEAAEDVDKLLQS